VIVKYFETHKINLELDKYILFYGKNSGLKNEIINTLIKDKKNVSHHDEKEILENQNSFLESILSKSLFDEEKIIIIRRSSDKILKIIDELYKKNIQDVTIILNADSLEKKSKLRTFFEKEKQFICTAFYPDNDQTLSKLAYNFLRDKKIPISPSNISLIVNKCSGDRETLINELQKIELFSKNGKRISSQNISKLINLNENHSISELIDNCLAKNSKKIISILNENNFSNEDCIVITRSFLIKAKKLLALSITFESNKNIELTISSAKPPIFWKEKEITKKQISKWKPQSIKKLIYSISETELQIKKNINNSINLITDFILLQSSITTNN
jgi:DNA polymerase-3 subunit delta